MAITEIIRALNAYGMDSHHIPSSTINVDLGNGESVSIVVGQVKKRKAAKNGLPEDAF